MYLYLRQKLNRRVLDSPSKKQFVPVQKQTVSMVVQRSIKDNPNWSDFKTWAHVKGFNAADIDGGEIHFNTIVGKAEIYEKLAAANAVRYMHRTPAGNLDVILSVLSKEGSAAHGWIRHGCDVTDEELRGRLTGDKKDRNGVVANTIGQPSGRFISPNDFKNIIDSSGQILTDKITVCVQDLKPKINDYKTEAGRSPRVQAEFVNKKNALETGITTIETNHIHLQKNPQQPDKVKLCGKYSIEQQSAHNLAKSFLPGDPVTEDTAEYKYTYTKWVNIPQTKIADINDATEVSGHRVETNFPEKVPMKLDRLEKVTKAG